MGGILSSQTHPITVTEVPPVQATVEESKPNDTVETTTTLAAEPMSDTVTDPVVEPVVNSSTLTDNPNEVLERYVEPVGKKVEVAPVAVTTETDVIKKTKKKNKNKNKSKQETQN